MVVPDWRYPVNPDDLLRVALYESEAEAQLAQAALKEQGIDAKLTGNEASALGLSLEGADDIEVIVRRDEYDRAEAILKELATVEPDHIPAWTCKQCGEEVDEGFAICWNCGADYSA